MTKQEFFEKISDVLQLDEPATAATELTDDIWDSAAREIAPNGVRVNVISPADISTPMTHRNPDYLKNKANIYPLGVGEVADAAELAVFLLSKKSKWITAQDYVLDCGAY